MKYITLAFLWVMLIGLSLGGSVALTYCGFVKAWGLHLVSLGWLFAIASMQIVWSLMFTLIYSGMGKLTKSVVEK